MAGHASGAAFLSLFVICALPGCNGDGGSGSLPAELKAAQERIRVLEQHVQDLNLEKQARQGQLKQDIDQVRMVCEEKINQIRSGYEQKIGDLERKIADLQQDLGLAEKERLTLEAIATQPARLAAAKAANFAVERSVWVGLVLLALAASVIFAFWSFVLRAQRRRVWVHTVDRIAQ